MSDLKHPLSLLSILPETPEERTLQLLVQLAVEMAGADEGSILVLDETTQELVFAMTVGPRLSEHQLRGQRVPVGKGITGLAALTREVQTGVPTFMTIEQSSERRPANEPTAVLAAPMLVADDVVGVLTAVSFTPDFRFKGKEVELYGKFASVAGILVERKRRLDHFEALQNSSVNTGNNPREALESRIISSVRRLVHSRPDALENIAAMLDSVENLTTPL